MIEKKFTLDKAIKGCLLKILTLPTDLLKLQLIRLGLIEGSLIECIERLPGGTVVVQKNRQELAIGFEIANKIFVTMEID